MTQFIISEISNKGLKNEIIIANQKLNNVLERQSIGVVSDLAKSFQSEYLQKHYPNECELIPKDELNCNYS